jgi:hypothetical protein
MALVNCSTCGKQISDQATACPGCGAPVRVATSTIPNIYSNKCVGNAIMLFGIAMFTVFLLCVWYVYGHRGEEYNLHALLIGGLWVVGPPVWFLIEHFFLFRYFGDSSQYDQFNRVQELASKIWAGAVIVLTAIYTDSFPR